MWPNTTTSKWFPIKQGSRVWHTLKDYTPIRDPECWISGYYPNLYLKHKPLPISNAWIEKDDQVVLSYIEACNNGLE